MAVHEFPFGEWLPDQPDYQNAGMVEADNVYPTARGFGPFETASATAATTTEPITGAQMFFDNSGNSVVVMGGSTILATKRSTTVAETGSYNATSAGWSFERFNDLIIAVSIENDPQYLDDIDTDDTWSALPGTPPKAAQIGRVGDFLVLGDLVDITAGNPTVPNRVRWSAFNNPTTAWVTDRGELSDYRDLDPKYGRVTAIVGGRFGLIFQERAIWRMTFVGAPKVFEFAEVSVDRGCIAAGSAVTIAADTFFLSQDGFWKTNGSDVQQIGAERVNDWFNDEVDDGNVKLTHGALNWPKRSIVWTFYPAGSSAFTKQIIYNFVLNKWSSASQTIDFLTKSQIDALTIGDLAGLFATIGDMSAYTLGSSEWKAKDLSFAAFIPGGQTTSFSSGFSTGFAFGATGSAFANMTGATAEANLVTGDTQIEPGYRSRVTGAWPIVQTQDTTLTTKIRSRATQGGAISTTTATTKAADGFCPHNVDNWIHSVRTTIPAGITWDHASGVQVRAVRSGRR